METDVFGEVLTQKPEQHELEKAKSRMDSPPFLFDVFINHHSEIQAFFDTGCLPYAAFSENLVRTHNLPRIPIPPRPLQLAKDGTPDYNLNSLTYATVDVNGRVERVYGYIIPHLHYDLILGKGWAERNHAVYKAKRRLLQIGQSTHRTNVHESGWLIQHKPHLRENARLTCAAVFAMELRRAARDGHAMPLCTVSVADIEKALAKLDEKKNPPTLEELRASLPKEIRDRASDFLDDVDGELPPHRERWDHEIHFEKHADGTEKTAPYGPLYEMSREELLVLRKTLTDLLSKGWVRASSSPASAPVLFARKPGGGLRFCVDYRGLNAITKKDRYPLPLVRETLRNLSTARFLTKLDVRAAFHRLRVREGDEWKTAFRTRYGQFEWLVTPFGLCGAPATFQRYINSALDTFLDDFCSAYMDDVIIYSDGDYLDHMQKVSQVMKRLAEAGLRLDRAKCEFAVSEVKYLGFVIRAGEGVTVDPAKIEAIRHWEDPTNVPEIRSFLGFANFYREFIPRFSVISEPLNRLTKKDVRWDWSNEQRNAFNQLKDILISSPLLALFNSERETVLEADCSGWALGAVVSQVDERGRLRPTGYFSRRLTAAEVNYDIHDKELLAITASMKHFQGELRSVSNFTVLSDHRNLQYFMTCRHLSERQVRLAGDLASFNFKIVFRSGRESGKPDSLSRRAQDKPKDTSDERLAGRTFQLLQDKWLPPQYVAKDQGLIIKNQLLAGISLSPLHTDPLESVSSTNPEPVDPTPPKGRDLFEAPDLQILWDRGIDQDKEYSKIYTAVALGHRSFTPQLKLSNVQIVDCTIDDRGALLRRGVLWVPDWEPLRTSLVQQTHDSHLTGHPGRDGTLAILQRSYFWPQQYLSVRQFTRNCSTCSRSKFRRLTPRGLLRPLPVPERFHSELSIDFMTDLPADDDGPRFLMVITDRLLKSCTLEAMTSMEAEACAECFLKCHYRFHGFPSAITSDRGSNWVGHFWSRLCKLVGVEQRLSTAYHPQTDGATERMNQEVLAYLRIFISYAQTDWPQQLPSAMLALNNRDSSVTGYSPFFLTHGYHAEPIQQVRRTPGSRQSPTARAESFVSRLHEGQETAKAAMATAQQVMEHQANRGRRPAERLAVGEKVWLNLKNVSTPQLKKKLAWTQAQYRVTKCISPDVYELDVPTQIHPRFHVDLLRRDPNDPLPSQIQDETQPPPLLDGDDPLWGVERVIRAEHRGRGRQRQVLVKWNGYLEPTWEPRSNLKNTDAFKAFVRKYGAQDNVGEDDAGARTGPRPRVSTRTRKQQTESAPLAAVMGFLDCFFIPRFSPSLPRALNPLFSSVEVGPMS